MSFRTPDTGGRISTIVSLSLHDRRLWTVVAIVLLACRTSTPTVAQVPQSGAGGAAPGLFGQRTLGTPSGPGRGLLGSSGGPGQALSQSGNLLTGNERFLRGNQQGRFVGRDASEVADLVRSLTGGLTDSRGMGRAGFDRGPRGGDRGRRRAGPGGATGPAAISAAQRPRTRLRVAFRHPSPPAVATVENLRTRLNGYLGEPAIGLEIDPQLQGRTLILRGTVASEGDRALAERLARLEPGVSRVQNLLDVASGPPDRVPQE